MKKLLTKIGLPRATGLYVSDREIAISRVAYTPFGPIEIARHSETYEPDQFEVVLDRVLTEVLGRKKSSRTSVAVGVPALKVFFSTRPIQTKHGDPSPQVLLREALQSQSASIDGMLVDLIKAQPGRRPVASIAACQRSYLTHLVDRLQKCGVRPYRVEPGPAALLRAAAHRHPAPRRAKNVLRILLGETQGIAVVAAGNLPLLWRSFELPRGDEGSAIVSVTRSLQALNKYCGLDAPLDAVLLHGRTDLRGLLDFDWVQEEIGATTEWFENGALETTEFAFGLALGSLDPNETAFDLSRSLKARARLREIFPWGETALQASVVFCMALFLGFKSRCLSRTYEAVKADNARHAQLASLDHSRLEKEKRELQQRINAIRKFLASRILWTSYTQEIPDKLPENVFLTSFHGRCDLAAPAKNVTTAPTAQKQFVLRGAASIPNDGSMPHEIDSFLGSIRENSLLKRDFPNVELADLKQVQPGGTASSLAFFTVVCLPKQAGGTTGDGKQPAGSQPPAAGE